MSNLAWKNGELLTFESAGLDSNGWPTGSGIFETIKTVDGVPWAFSRHMRRALTSARRLNQPFPAEESIRNAASIVIATNEFTSGRLRIHFSSHGDLIMTHQFYHPSSSPANLMIRQSDRNSTLLIDKRYPYTFNLELLDEAKAAGFDDFLLINQADEVTESAVSNLLFQIGSDWVTPPLSSGVLPGIVRGILIEKAGVLVRKIRSSDLSEVRAGFLLSSLKIAQPIGRINEQIMQISGESEQMRAVIAATALATSVG